MLSEEAGISRGLLYHYFGNKEDFHRAVVRRAADDLIAVTAPGQGDDLTAVLTDSLGAYVDYVVANRPGYLSLVRAAAGGNEALRQIYEEARAIAGPVGCSSERDSDSMSALGYDDTPAVRLIVAGAGARLRSRWCSTGRPTSTG